MPYPQPILVTGGAGFIGSHVCKLLAQTGYTPITYDNFQGGHRWAACFGPLVEADIHDTAKLKTTIQQYQPIAVFHLASSINVRESLENPGKYYHNNVVGTLSLLDAMKESNTKLLVFSSTASIFGNPDYVPIDEKHPKRPLHAYGKSKYMVEQILEDFQRAHGITSACLRYFNACGADVDGQIGEAHNPETHLIPLVIETALGKKPHISIYGDDYDTEDGTAIRDYIHVTDLADAHIKALEYLLSTNKSFQANLGTGTGYSIKQIIKAVENISGKKVAIQQGPKSPDAACLIATPRLANQLLNWSARHSHLDHIIETALRWHTNKK
jgi:UDP-arabinose 4-epimerase